MRLSVFIAEQVSQQLIIDLQKIYADLIPSDTFTEQALVDYISQPSQRLFMTMFNERHIGALKVSIVDNKATLSALSIREITRRRGVGKNLLKQVEKKLQAENISSVEYDLNEINSENRAITELFLNQCGYHVQDKIAVKTL